MRGFGQRESEDEMMTEINIVPLTDVMLVLLVIFMVATPLLVIDSLKIKLPKAAAGEAEKTVPITITVTERGAIYLNAKAVPIEELYDVLSDEFSSSVDAAVLIKGDEGTLHGVVVEVLDTAKRAGAKKLSIATEDSSR